MIKVTIKMFGIFQEYFSDDVILFLNDGDSILNLKKNILNKFVDNAFNNFDSILCKSVFSNSNSILSDNYILSNDEIIYLLPPFSGG